MSRKLVVLVLSVAVVMTGYVVMTTATSPSVWISTQLSITPLASGFGPDSPYDKPCQPDSQAYTSYSSFGSPVRQTIGGCYIATAFGSMGADQNDTTYMRLGAFGGYNRLELAFSSFRGIPVPGSNKMVMTYPLGGSYGRGMAVFDDVAGSFRIPAGSTTYQATGSPSWTAENPSTQQPLTTNAIGFSDNGAWALVEVPNVGFARLDMVTHDLLMIAPAIGVYGFGANPTLQLAMSNDGRYGMIVGETNSAGLRIVDTAACTPAANPMDVASGCVTRDLQPELSQLDGKQLYNGAFSNDGTTAYINTRATANDPTMRYAISGPPSIAHPIDYLAMGDSFSSGEGDAKGQVSASVLSTITGGAFWGPFITKYTTPSTYLPGTDGNANPLAAENIGIDVGREKCHISFRSYPFIISAVYGMGDGESTDSRFRSVACSGAKLEDTKNLSDERVRKSGYRGSFDQFDLVDNNPARLIKNNALNTFTPGRAAQKSFLSTYKPKSATLTIGGNDADLGGIIEQCAVKSLGTCAAASDPIVKAKIGANIAALSKTLSSTFAELRQASPQTKLYVMGYPRLVQLGNNCGPSVWLDQAERTLADNFATYINDVIRVAAANNGIKYIDVENALLPQGLCSGVANPAVNGVRVGDDQPSTTLAGVQISFGPFGSESYHPNSRGHSLMAQAVMTQIGNPTTYQPCPVVVTATYCGSKLPAPSTPVYFGTYTEPEVPVAAAFVRDVSGAAVDAVDTVIVKPAQEVGRAVVGAAQAAGDAVNGVVLKPFTSFALELHSTPVMLATGTTAADGSIDVPFGIPAGTEPGYHTLHIKATMANGELVDMAQEILVIATENDVDGDGLLNTTDQCPFITPSGVDANADGYDDACPSENEAYPYTAPADTTAPSLTNPVFSINPKAVTQTSVLSVSVADPAAPPVPPSTTPAAVSGVDATSGEYYLGDTDPGQGNGAKMTWQDATGMFSVSIGTDYPTGVYKITMRAKDSAGNWSQSISDYLVVYNPAGPRMTGKKAVTPSLSAGDSLPGLVNASQPDKLTFGFSVRYDSGGTVAAGSDLQLSYTTGTKCDKPAQAQNCHSLELNSTSIQWLTTSGANNATGTFQGMAALKVDGATSTVVFRVSAADGKRLSPDPGNEMDSFAVSIFPPGTNPNTATPTYIVHTTALERGNVKIRDA